MPFRSEARRVFESNLQPARWRLSYGEMTGSDGQLQRCSRISRSTRPGDPNFGDPATCPPSRDVRCKRAVMALEAVKGRAEEQA